MVLKEPINEWLNYILKQYSHVEKNINTYMLFIPEVAQYVEDGVNIMIKHGWMEEPPQAVDHDNLLH